MTQVKFKWGEHESVIDVNSVMFAEARAIEKVTGSTFKETMDQLVAGSMEAVQAFVWIAFKRSDPGMKFSDLDNVPLTDVDVITEEEVPEEPGNPPADAESAESSAGVNL